MKFVLVSILLISNVYSFDMTHKNPALLDISIIDIIDNACASSGYFNPAVCVEKVSTCYSKSAWPKTVMVNYKLQVIFNCLGEVSN